MANDEPAPVPPRAELAQLLRLKRNAAGLTGAELAASAGVSSSYITLLEKGQRLPSVELLQKLAAPLNAEPEELIALRSRAETTDADDLGETLGSQPRTGIRISPAWATAATAGLVAGAVGAAVAGSARTNDPKFKPWAAVRASNKSQMLAELVYSLTDLRANELLLVKGYVDGIRSARDERGAGAGVQEDEGLKRTED